VQISCLYIKLQCIVLHIHVCVCVRVCVCVCVEETQEQQYFKITFKTPSEAKFTNISLGV
jgi:hypothetical protein